MNALPNTFTTPNGRTIGGTVLDLRNITLRFGGVEAITDISFDVREGKVRAIIEPSGAGTWSALSSTAEPITLVEMVPCPTGSMRLRWRRGSGTRRPGRRAGRLRSLSTWAGLGRTTAFAILLATPAIASGDVIAEWRDLHGRCAAAVTAGTVLDVSGLEQRAPTMIADVVEEPPFGVRIEYDVLRTSARTVPTGIWGVPGGRFEMQVLDFPTRAGVRGICEVAVARGAAALGDDEARSILNESGRIRDEAVAGGGFAVEAFDAEGGTVRLGMTSTGPNPRGCPVVVSLTADAARGYFRSSAAELAGAPGCGGPSLAPGGLTRTPASLNPRGTP